MYTAQTAEQGKAIRALREMASLTLDDVAKEAGVSAAYLSRVETGKASTSAKWLGLVSSVIASHLKTAA